jgi:hypothetical protein
MMVGVSKIFLKMALAIQFEYCENKNMSENIKIV